MDNTTNKAIPKEDENADLKAKLASSKAELEHLRKDNEEQKSVVDKLLSELHLHRENVQRIEHLEHEVQSLKQLKQELEQRDKEQLEKIKKREAQCQALEAKVKELETNCCLGEPQQEFSPNVVLLNERIGDYEMKIRTQEANLTEIQAALQSKTIELLESMENVEKLEHDLKKVKRQLRQRDEAVIQLKNALAASQEQKVVSNDCGDSIAFDDLSEELAKVEADLMVARESAPH